MNLISSVCQLCDISSFHRERCINNWISCYGILIGSINSILVSLRNCSLLEELDLSFNLFSGNNLHIRIVVQWKKWLSFSNFANLTTQKECYFYGSLQTFIITWIFDPHRIWKSHQYSKWIGFFQQVLH